MNMSSPGRKDPGHEQDIRRISGFMPTPIGIPEKEKL